MKFLHQLSGYFYDKLKTGCAREDYRASVESRLMLGDPEMVQLWWVCSIDTGGVHNYYQGLHVPAPSVTGFDAPIAWCSRNDKHKDHASLWLRYTYGQAQMDHHTIAPRVCPECLELVWKYGYVVETVQ